MRTPSANPPPPAPKHQAVISSTVDDDGLLPWPVLGWVALKASSWSKNILPSSLKPRPHPLSRPYLCLHLFGRRRLDPFPSLLSSRLLLARYGLARFSRAGGYYHHRTARLRVAPIPHPRRAPSTSYTSTGCLTVSHLLKREPRKRLPR